MQLYCVRHKINGKRYIGITSGALRQRWARHVHMARRGTSGHLYAAIREHGDQAFFVETMMVCADWKYLCSMEIAAIAAFDTRVNGYNMTTGGDGAPGLPKSEETRRKLSLANMGKIKRPETIEKLRAASLGKKLAPHVIEMLRAQHLGKPISAEHKAAISAKNSCRPSPFKGIPRPLATRERIAAAIRAHWVIRKGRDS